MWKGGLNVSKFVYRNKVSMEKIHELYDRTLYSLNVKCEEVYLNTSYGKTHILILGNSSKEKLITLHGGNGMNPLNIKLFKPLLEKYCIIAPDVIGMPGKSDPYRTLSSSREDYGVWINEIMKLMDLNEALFVVSSYSAAMMLSLAKIHPERIKKAVLLVPSGIAHGPIFSIISKMMIPFMKYYIHATQDNLRGIMHTMITDEDEEWEEFLHLMMSGYKMEMRAPKEYKAQELSSFLAPVLVIASKNDVFFPAEKVFLRLPELFKGSIDTITIEDRHLPSKQTMVELCSDILSFFERRK